METDFPIMKFCANCKWKEENIQLPSSAFWKCLHPLVGVDLVSGTKPYAYCKVERFYLQTHSACGPEGKLWEPKP